MKILPSTKFDSVDQYHSVFPKEVAAMLEEMRATIRQAAPKAEEVISYNMPAFKQHGILVYYAAAKSHIGLYPTNSPIAAFAEELKKYKTSKGAIQFPIGEKLPKTLIKKIVKYRILDDKERELAKATKKKAKKK